MILRARFIEKQYNNKQGQIQQRATVESKYPFPIREPLIKYYRPWNKLGYLNSHQQDIEQHQPPFRISSPYLGHYHQESEQIQYDLQIPFTRITAIKEAAQLARDSCTK